MPAGAGGISDVLPEGGSWGPSNLYIGDIGGIRSYGLRIPGVGFVPSPLPHVSLGPGTISVLQPSFSVPAQVSVSPSFAAVQRPDEGGYLPPEIDRRDIPPEQEELSMAQVIGRWIDYWPAIARGENVLPPGTILPSNDFLEGAILTGAPVLGGAIGTPSIEEEDTMGWLGDVYDDVDAVLGGLLPGGVPPGGNVFDIGTGFGGPAVAIPTVTTSAPPAISMPGLPPGVSAPQCASGNPYPGYIYKWHCGGFRWVKKSKSRRKRLASPTDIKDLAALMPVTTPQQKSVWIATHS